MPPPVAAQKGQIVNLLDEVTTGIGIGVVLPISSNYIRITLRGSGVISGGTLSIKEAATYDYAGDWSTILINDAETIDATELDSDAEKVIHIYATFGAIRVEVVDNITGGGNVSAELVCN